ncbi:MAG: AraC family transcriptional regulator [Planctomycetaceae bacterium]|nr:AraC family transcriptional regulator [Planctomycetaceae bacterium]
MAKTTKKPMEFSWLEGHYVGRGASDRAIHCSELVHLQRPAITFVGQHVWTPDCWSYARSHPCAQVIVTFGGRGRFYIDGQWQVAEKNTVFVCRPGCEVAVRGLKGYRWQLCAVMYSQGADENMLESMPTPTLYPADVTGLHMAVENLFRELSVRADTSVLEHMVALIDAESRCLIHSPPKPRRLGELWAAIEADVGQPWTVERMAEFINVSERHLGRLCHEETGTYPQAYLAYLRMRRAANLLMARDHSVETVAKLVGYDSPFAFSNAFKERHGLSPTAFRKTRQDCTQIVRLRQAEEVS